MFVQSKNLTHRRFLALAAILLPAVCTIGSAHGSSLVPQTALPGDCVPQFAAQLPVFGHADSTPRVDALANPSLTATMKEIDQAVLPVGMTDTCGKGITFGKTRVWAYETSNTITKKILGPASWPAVTIEAQRHFPAQVKYVNRLPSFNPNNPTGPGLVQGLLGIDQTLHWADPLHTPGCGMPLDCTLAKNTSSPCCQAYTGPHPATVHLHGAELTACNDGQADTWFTPDGKNGPRYCTSDSPGRGEDILLYQNYQEPGTLWFHDHVLGPTRNDVFGGLGGFYFLRDPSTEPGQLPSGPYEIEMAIQDRQFDTNSQLYLTGSGGPGSDNPPPTPNFHPFWNVNFSGDVAIVNGAAWPYLKVEPRRYRFRLLNGAIRRRFDLHFGNAPVWQIGADDVYLDRPVRVNNRACQDTRVSECSDVSLLPGERADIVVDFTNLAGQNITVTNTGLDPVGIALPNVMQFQVVLPLKGRDNSCDPEKPNPIAGICSRRIPMVRLTDGQGNVVPGVHIDKVRQLVVNELNTTAGGTIPTGEIEEFVNNTYWDGLQSEGIAGDPDFAKIPLGATELPQVGSTELWEIIDFETAGGQAWHAMHTHLVQFQILNRQNLKGDFSTGFDYEKAYDAAFGTGPVQLPSRCPTANEFCPGYGPPLPYNTLNADGAIGGNPAVGDTSVPSYLSGAPIPPDPGETGWKDTVKTFPGQVTRILVRWAPTDTPIAESRPGVNSFPFDPAANPFAEPYIWHCHLLSHEDNEMMRPLVIRREAQ
jgi:spore coat protein A, manganese oxidase